MFSRWSQNFFKYMRAQFNDSLPSHDLAPLDPDAQVVSALGGYAAAWQRPAIVSLEHHRDTVRRRLPRNLTNSSSSVPSYRPCRLAGACSWTWCA